jgi:aspartate 1-decarboxylase
MGVTIDANLLEAADIREFERVQIIAVTKGDRIETYALGGRRGSGELIVSGAGAEHFTPGDRVLIVSYGTYSDSEPTDDQRVVLADARNQPSECRSVVRPGPQRVFQGN